MNPSSHFSQHEIDLIADAKFFQTKADVMRKVRRTLEELHGLLRRDLATAGLLTPPGFDLERCQFVKGEHLEECPYQYLDFPKHFIGTDKMTFRSLFWWGHHFVFALILEGRMLQQYKQNLWDRFHAVAGKDISLCLSSSLWEWKCGEGYTLPITHDRKPEIAAVLSGRHAFKVARFVPPVDPAIREGRIVEIGREALRAVLPILTP